MEPEPSRQSTRSIFPLQAKDWGRQQKKKKARSDTRWEGNIASKGKRWEGFKECYDRSNGWVAGRELGLGAAKDESTARI